MKRKIIIAFLVMLALILTTGTFAYWATNIEGTSLEATNALNIGSGKVVETKFDLSNSLNSGGLLVPSSQINEDSTGVVDEINLTYTLAWNEDNSVTQIDGTITEGNVHITHQISITKNGRLLDQTEYSNIYDLINLEYHYSNTDTMILNGDSSDFFFKITMDEPKDQAEYKIISSSNISFSIFFEIDESTIKTTDINSVSQADGPYIELLGGSNITWELGETFVDPGYTAYDSEGNEISNVWFNGNYNTWTLGEFTLTYQAYSSLDNLMVDSVTRKVTVVDTTAPTIKMSTDSLSFNASKYQYIDADYITKYIRSITWATDLSNQLGDITFDGLNSIDTTIPGNYPITISVEDGSGNVGYLFTTVEII